MGLEDAAKTARPHGTEYFTGLAALYADHRPSYPPEAIRWVARTAIPRALAADVGCGTGISTRLLAAEGLRVLGVDPNADMLAAAAAVPSPGLSIAYCAGSAEALPLRASVASLVLCAQAFHWFEASTALGEFHRILIPAGRLVTMWNTPDLDDEASALYARIAARARALARAAGRVARTEREADVTPGGHFVDPERREFANPHRLDRHGLLGRARSSSYWPRDAPGRAGLERDLLALFDTHQQNGAITLRQWTVVTMARRS